MTSERVSMTNWPHVMGIPASNSKPRPLDSIPEQAKVQRILSENPANASPGAGVPQNPWDFERPFRVSNRIGVLCNLANIASQANGKRTLTDVCE
jgi:hypothetical protein